MTQKGESFLPFVWKGDLYEFYYNEEGITRIFVAYDNMNVAAVERDWNELPSELRHKIEDRIHLNK